MGNNGEQEGAGEEHLEPPSPRPSPIKGEGENDAVKLYRADGSEYVRCESDVFQHPEINGYLAAWNHYQSGFLPKSGGVNDQLERDLQAIEIVNNEHARWIKKNG